MTVQFAIIVGSGFEGFVASGDAQHVTTRFGDPSAAIRPVDFDGHSVYVLSRHGDDHTLPPHKVNYRANLQALKQLGTEAIVALNTVGVVSDKREPGQIAVPDQLTDYTWGRAHTIYAGDDAEFAHIDFTEPFSGTVRKALLAAAGVAGVDCYDGGVYAATQGPRLETAAEVDRLERDGADYVGMTAMPEASLARELDIAYACLSLIVKMQVLKQFLRSR